MKCILLNAWSLSIFICYLELLFSSQWYAPSCMWDKSGLWEGAQSMNLDEKGQNAWKKLHSFEKQMFSVLEIYSSQWSNDLTICSSSTEDRLLALSSHVQHQNHLHEKSTLRNVKLAKLCVLFRKQKYFFSQVLPFPDIKSLKNYILQVVLKKKLSMGGRWSEFCDVCLQVLHASRYGFHESTYR